MHKCVHGGLPGYLEDNIVVYNQRYPMNTRSSNSNIVMIMEFFTFKLWNSLPLEWRKNVSLKVFNLKLPSILFFWDGLHVHNC